MCAGAHGYEPRQSEALGAYQLGPGEIGWRACVYDGIRRLMMPSSEVPEVYAELIAEDRRMTEAIGAGEMTRGQRRERLARLIAGIEEREAAVREALLKELEAARERLYALQARLERMSTIQKMQGPAFSVSMGQLK